MSSVLLDIIRNVERSNSILIKGIDIHKSSSKIIVLVYLLDTLRVTPGRNLLRCFASAK